MAGISDIRHELCLALALWNGVDPILKERMFGLTGPQGNHGEDVKEYWWYLTHCRSHAWLRWRYHYPQAAVPVPALAGASPQSARTNPSWSCWTPVCSTRTATGRWMSPTRRHPRPRSSPGSSCGTTARSEASLSVLPTMWFRNTWRITGDQPPASVPGRRRHRRRPSATGRLPARRCPARATSHRERCSATTRPTIRACSVRRRSPPYPEGRHQRSRGDRRGDGEPRAAGHQGRLVVSADRPGRRHCRDPVAAAPTAARPVRRTVERQPAAPLVGGRPSTRRWPPGSGRPTSSTPHWRQPAPTRNGCGCYGRPAPGWCGASRCTRTG